MIGQVGRRIWAGNQYLELRTLMPVLLQLYKLGIQYHKVLYFKLLIYYVGKIVNGKGSDPVSNLIYLVE